MTLSEATVRTFIDRWVREHVAATAALELPPGRNLIADGVIDSLGFLNLVGALETEFSVELDFGDREPEEFTTIGGLSGVVVASGGRGA